MVFAFHVLEVPQLDQIGFQKIKLVIIFGVFLVFDDR